MSPHSTVDRVAHARNIAAVIRGGCPKGGTHVFPWPGSRYDDGRCLKCGVRKK